MLKRKSQMSDAAVAVLAALIAVSLAACGGPTGPDAFVDSASPTVILRAALDNVEVGSQRVIDFRVSRPGTLALTVSWNDPNNSVTAVLTGVGCPNFDGAPADCQERRLVERQWKEGRGVIDYPGASGAYRLVVENQGPGVESISVTAALSSPPAPVLPAPYPTGHPPTSYPPGPRREK
jgi:hypothetical protein